LRKNKAARCCICIFDMADADTERPTHNLGIGAQEEQDKNIFMEEWWFGLKLS